MEPPNDSVTENIPGIGIITKTKNGSGTGTDIVIQPGTGTGPTVCTATTTDASDGTDTATAVAAVAVAVAVTAAAAKGTNADDTTTEDSTASATPQRTGATATATATTSTTTTSGTKRVIIMESATRNTSKQPFLVQPQEGSNELSIHFEKAIEAAADIEQSTTTMPDILVSHKSFGTIDYLTDDLLATWWKAGQPCMAVDNTVVILIICMGAYKGVCYGIHVSRQHPPTIIEISTNSLNLRPNLSPTNETFKDPVLNSNFLPGRKIGTKQVPRAVPIRLNMVPAILE